MVFLCSAHICASQIVICPTSVPGTASLSNALVKARRRLTWSCRSTQEADSSSNIDNGRSLDATTSRLNPVNTKDITSSCALSTILDLQTSTVTMDQIYTSLLCLKMLYIDPRMWITQLASSEWYTRRPVNQLPHSIARVSC